MRLEPLQRRHIPACVALEQLLFPGDSPWPDAAFHTELDAGGYYLAALDEQEQLVGYAGLALMGTPGDWEAGLHTIAVHPDHQGRGIGRALLRALLEHADELRAAVVLEVRTDNDTAITLYERHGFERVGLRKRYYQPSGADAYTMVRPSRRMQEVAG